MLEARQFSWSSDKSDLTRQDAEQDLSSIKTPEPEGQEEDPDEQPNEDNTKGREQLAYIMTAYLVMHAQMLKYDEADPLYRKYSREAQKYSDYIENNFAPVEPKDFDSVRLAVSKWIPQSSLKMPHRNERLSRSQRMDVCAVLLKNNIMRYGVWNKSSQFFGEVNRIALQYFNG